MAARAGKREVSLWAVAARAGKRYCVELWRLMQVRGIALSCGGSCR